MPRGPSPTGEIPETTLATFGGRLCPVCGRVVAPSIDVDTYRLFSCSSCGSWCSDALLRNATTSFTPTDYFENAASDRNKWNELLRHLDHSGRTFRSVLDVGCGNGAFLRFLREIFPGVSRAGIELDPERAAQARATNPDALVLPGDLGDALETIEQRFDLITLWDVFEHLPAPGPALHSLATRLSDRGCIFLQTIHEHSLVPRLGRLSYRVTAGAFRYLARRTHEAHHLVFFSRKGLEILAANANLHIREQWFDRLALARMDGNPLLTLPASLLLTVENALGNGLFINVLLDKQAHAGSGTTPRPER